MIKNSVLGIIFANSHDAMLGELTAQRSMASVPFGAQFRLIDFPLSNFANAKVSKAGIITKTNYYSLMTHIGSGKPWDLDRKIGGLSILPPYASAETQKYKGKLEALYGILEYLQEATEDYVILSDADVIANINIRELIKQHKTKNADITIAYAEGKKPLGQRDSMSFHFDSEERITEVNFDDFVKGDCSFGLDTMIVSRTLLIEIIENQMKKGNVSLSHGIFAEGQGNLKIYGFKHTGFTAVMDGIRSYYDANMALLNAEKRQALFNKENPVYTKSRDDMPARYGINAKVKNSIVGDGCVIEGTVINSVLFRGVKIGKGTTVENCIIMDATEIGDNCNLSNLIADRNVVISDGNSIDGTRDKYYIKLKEKV